MKPFWRLADRLAEATVVLSYTATGYHLRQKLWEPEALDIDLKGRNCLITGANSGLGLAAAKRLAGLGARVILVARNEQKGEGALAEVARAATGQVPRLEITDVSDLSAVRDLAARLQESLTKLDILINNAGVLLDRRQTSADGIEMTLATNVIGGFLLLHQLEPLLSAAAPSRVIHVTSGGMYTQKLDLEALVSPPEPFNGTVAYAQTKRAQVMLNEMWAERLQPRGVVSHAMHPGWADTPGVERSLPRFHKLLRPILRSPQQGADTIVWLAASDQAIRETGKLYFDREPRRTHIGKRTVSPPEDYRHLWALCEKLSCI